ncbi:hypothetical protein GGH91_000132 [Coemansia sp. RSA 2671]|nr:hypothetical protein IWW57_005503 [Coemansia sp. S610]KAJ2350444.1 hypothetical protein GGH91_000132 [Coemansia sp. RSA 2671]KAJ2701381.1 hypothetical protein H4218_001446 [Coemansia sp. IMI 209128]
MTNSQANDKKEALKRKLRSSSSKPGSVAKHGRTVPRLPKQKKAKEGLFKLAASTKHSAGRRSVRQALDQTTLGQDVSESLRGVNQAPILTLTQLAQKAKQEREKMAVIYEEHQTAVSETVDELAQLMSSG